MLPIWLAREAPTRTPEELRTESLSVRIRPESELGMVSGAKTRRDSVLTTGSSTVQGLWGTGTDEFLELLEEEISEDILDQMEATKNPEKKIEKNSKQALEEAKRTEYEEERIEK